MHTMWTVSLQYIHTSHRTQGRTRSPGPTAADRRHHEPGIRPGSILELASKHLSTIDVFSSTVSGRRLIVYQ